ncbi:MAG: orotate phosphoribosyltransferase [Fervidicoccus sp.]
MSGIAVEFLKNRIIKIGKFKLTSGIESPFYIDLRRLYSFPSLREKVVEEIVKRFPTDQADVIVGIATSGIALASFIGCKTGKPIAYVRLDRKEHGTQALLEGEVRNKKAVVVDDVATTGGSLEHAISAVKEMGGNVMFSVVVVDREQGAREKLKSIGVELYSLFTAKELFKELYESNTIDEKTYKEIQEYLSKY